MKRILLVLVLVLGGCSRSRPAAPPTPTPVPLSPTELLNHADQARELGQVDQAASDYQQLILEYPQAPEARMARFGLAYSAYLRADWAAAQSQLAAFTDENVNDALQGRALFLLARLAENSGNHQGAIDAYLRYEATAGPLTGYAAIRRAAQLAVLGRADEA
ncbi:MAG TPA: tetratricopeptide repeat protein, partial [Herpetosiphonaceae bacterium]|nr:tetratricopeptide repeat protein [Herpetosiphonaceae bacterium]